MGSVSGSIEKLIFDGTTFDVPHDANFSEVPSGVENEMMPTSGDSVLKQTKRSQNVEGVIVIADPVQSEQLRLLSTRKTTYPISYETAEGATRTTVGTIQLETKETETNRVSLTILPLKNWTTFTV